MNKSDGVPRDDARKVAIDILSNWALRYTRAQTQFDINTAIFWASVRIDEAIDRALAAAIRANITKLKAARGAHSKTGESDG